MEKHMTVCPYCGAGCKFNLLVENGQVVGAEGLDGITNQGELCLKGMSGYDFINDTKILTPRILHPMIRRTKGAELERVSWDEALDFTAKKLLEIKEKHGADAILTTGSSRGPGNEANYVMQKFTRACIGTNNIDNCARTCHGPSVIGLIDTVGSGAMSVSIPNMENADCIMLFGYNPSASHPIVARRIVKAKERGAKIIVADPRIIETARIADIYMQINNGCNLAFVNAFANVIVSEGLMDKKFVEEHTSGFEAWWETVKNYTPEAVQDITGVDPETLRAAARMYATAGGSIIGWGMGVTQQCQGVHTVHQIAAIACVSGQIGRDNAGLAPVRGQNNVQGSCDMGMWPSLYPGYQKVADPAMRSKFAKAWGVSEDSLSLSEGCKLTDLPHLVKEGKIRAFYNFGEDPLQTEPDSIDMRETLENVEFLISQDIFMTQTTALADVVFPGTSWGEHDGVFSASDRTFQRFTAAVPPKGECKHDWQIFQELSTRMGYPMHYDDTKQIWDEVRELCPSFQGATYEKMAGVGYAQWPIPEVGHPGTPTLYQGGQFNMPDGKALLMTTDWKAPTELPDEEYPLILCTVREVGHYSCRSMTGNCKVLALLADEPGYVTINPADAEKRGIKDQDLVWVHSRRGKVISRAAIDERTNKGTVYMTYQWWIGKCNTLTMHATDPLSGTPEDKHSACQVDAIDDQVWAERHLQELYTDMKETLAGHANRQNASSAAVVEPKAAELAFA
ncbi:formate dehydrogenase subunit alpha [Berryella wangjianweii]|uniref:Formate dehydrogenase subunit alpha n=1 Tax=Berryella wangjianweii TaxID=2734634 RepID=A0A6M8J9C6_9ACTN|nr:formate dehydrogenase subunit alpha [Berryella wangjianweii]NPD32000.1 formate dehydrogenase subunit alpha [Eggerthellaceae bacterium zg-997]QKF07412.1 formate dehydrogenase subunit alpha [Berryella wangjianweii]